MNKETLIKCLEAALYLCIGAVSVILIERHHYPSEDTQTDTIERIANTKEAQEWLNNLKRVNEIILIPMDTVIVRLERNSKAVNSCMITIEPINNK
jgi:hypothetical protein